MQCAKHFFPRYKNSDVHCFIIFSLKVAEENKQTNTKQTNIKKQTNKNKN